ncbi:ATP-grasp domain-containing protein [bacterium]|nr:ATP-grasp domain-containing protein [bacterium]
MPKPFVTVVGATARAAAHSLARAGYAARAADLFADRDLTRFHTTARCPFETYPDALPALTESFPPGPVVYTGGLENHPRVVAELAARRPLWGNPPAVLEIVRDPFFPACAWPYTDRPVRCPAVLTTDAAPKDRGWVQKPRRGAGGDGVRPYHPAALPPAPETLYLQQFVAGSPMSALFSAVGGEAFLLGVTEQLVGEPWLHAPPFRYAGNVTAPELPGTVASALGAFGAALVRAGGLVGLFGVDFVFDGRVAWPVEINPRYPASAEVIEHATGRAVMTDHAAGCGAADGDRPVRRNPRYRVVGKAVYYAPHRITFPAAGPWDDWERPFDPWTLPAFADVPDPGGTVEPGWPVLTMLEGGSTPAAVRGRLQSRAADLDRLFAEDHTP